MRVFDSCQAETSQAAAPRYRRTRLVAGSVLAPIVVTLTLSGCSLSQLGSLPTSSVHTPHNVSTQSLESACHEMLPAVQSYLRDSDSSGELLLSDPVGAAAGFELIDEAFRDGAAEVRNKTVKPFSDAAARAVTTLASDVSAAATGDDTLDGQTLLAEWTATQTTIKALAATCAEGPAPTPVPVPGSGSAWL